MGFNRIFFIFFLTCFTCSATHGFPPHSLAEEKVNSLKSVAAAKKPIKRFKKKRRKENFLRTYGIPIIAIAAIGGLAVVLYKLKNERTKYDALLNEKSEKDQEKEFLTSQFNQVNATIKEREIQIGSQKTTLRECTERLLAQQSQIAPTPGETPKSNRKPLDTALQKPKVEYQNPQEEINQLKLMLVRSIAWNKEQKRPYKRNEMDSESLSVVRDLAEGNKVAWINDQNKADIETMLNSFMTVSEEELGEKGAQNLKKIGQDLGQKLFPQ